MKGTNAIIYARVSPKGSRAGRSGREAAAESLEQQLEIVREYAEGKGYVLGDEYVDEYMSGSDETRPGLWGAVEATRPGSVLVVWRYERLARSVFLEESIRRELTRRGARLEAVDGHNGGTAEDDLVRGILAYVAEYERKLIAKRTKAHMRARQKSGQLMSKLPPMGTSVDPEDPARLVPNDEELAQLEEMLQLRLAGISYREIARRMNHRGEEYRGRPFHHSLVRRGLQRWLEGRLPVKAPQAPPDALRRN